MGLRTLCIKKAGRDFKSVIIDPCTCFPNSNNTKSKQQEAALNPKRGNSYVYKKRVSQTFTLQETLSVKEKRRLPTLPRVCSTIGAGGLNCSVRNGKRWDPATIATLMTIMTNHNNKHEHKRFMKRQETTCQILRRKNSARGNFFGQLVVLGCDVTVCTPAPYQRHRL